MEFSFGCLLLLVLHLLRRPRSGETSVHRVDDAVHPRLADLPASPVQLFFTPTEVSGPPGSHNAFSAPLQTRDRGGRRHEAPLRTDPFSGVFRKTAKKTSVILTNQRKHPLALLNNRLAKPPQVQLKLKLSSS